jgi:hypothetical protein
MTMHLCIINYSTSLDDNITIPDQISVINCDASNLQSRKEIYKISLQHAYGENMNLDDGCVLAPLNVDVDEINEFALDRFPGQVIEVFSADSAKEGQEQLYPVEFLNTLQPNGFPNHKLRLKACSKMLFKMYIKII